MAWLLPEGISDVLPAEARHIEAMRRALLDLYRTYGYELVIPPLIEYLDSLLTGTGRDLDLRTFKLVDQLSGRQLGVRADITPQTARIDAHILNRAGVVRLSYAGSVLHTRPAQPLATRQPIQVGAELYGYAGLAADAEVQQLAVRSLRLARLADVHFEFGHTGIVRAILAGDESAAGIADELLAALGAKDRAALEDLGGRMQPATAAALGSLVGLHGAPAEVIERARRELPPLAAIVQSLDDLQALVARLEADSVSVDLSDLHGYRYYTGVNFAAYSAALGARGPIVRGGRYDDIGRAFGRARPATGFSIDLRELARINGAPAEDAIVAPALDDPALFTLVDSLRAAGEVVVCRLHDDDELRERTASREIRQLEGRWCVVPRNAA